ncbi:galactose oxidase [Sporormia fimetaria CBS 119925]|uniref:Galactose oxidase n=1 Tax=Sporormia fimetaria CBS 119925 TaxID=1340428 RepID=A0A6A6VMV9_9PLEO|nr:galactose oxidase [Sporormia fimetaria CBS 119925]
MLPLGVIAYPAVVGSTTPLSDDSPAFWKKRKALRVKRVWSTRRNRSQDSGNQPRPRCSLQSPRLSDHSQRASSDAPSLSPRTTPDHVPIIVPRHGSVVTSDSVCESLGFSSSRTSTVVSSDRTSLSDFPLPSRKHADDTTSPRSRHVEILIPDWILPVQEFPTSPIKLPVDLPRLKPSSSPLEKSSPDTMTGQTPITSRTNTIDSQTSAPSPSQLYPESFRNGTGAYISSVNSSQTSLHQPNNHDGTFDRAPTSSSRTPGLGMAPSPAMMQTAGLGTPSNSASGLSGLVCNVHRTTGREPHPLVGATTTVVGDKVYVFGGRKLSRTRPQLTSDLYELDLIRRHWVKIETKGDIPPPRYFHTVCALGDTKLVCYGGMSPAPQPGQPPSIPEGEPADGQPEVVVMSDLHIYDIPTRTWMRVATHDAPQGRYAHCATILPSSAVFSSANAPLSAIRHNPSSANPNQGSIGVQLDGEGGAEMVVVGGQDSGNDYIEQISVFNLRSLKWTATNSLGRSCGAYRSVVSPLTDIDPAKIGTGGRDLGGPGSFDQYAGSSGAPMLIYSNYHFMDVKLELQVRHPDGTFSEKRMQGNYNPPGLRFPNGGIINNHLVVSGTFITSAKQEYALWALDLRTLTWGRIEAGGNIFAQGSWNRGILWQRRNNFVIFGNRRRSLVDDYNHRRINFSHICVVELEAFGLYDNPRKVAPTSGFTSVSAPKQTVGLDIKAGGRQLFPAATELGQMALNMRELADMDFLAINGERIPVNSRLVARRWGPYFNHLLREATVQEHSDTATLRPPMAGHPSRNSSMTITPSIRTAYSNATTLTDNTTTSSETVTSGADTSSPFSPPDAKSQPPQRRPRTLYLPHTHLTVQALVHYLYTSSLPPRDSPLSTPQILCSLLQIARPYQVDGLLEAIIARLHVVLDNRNTAAIFNAAAMAAGGGSGVAFAGVNGVTTNGTINGFLDPSSAHINGVHGGARSLDPALRALRIDTEVDQNGHDDEVSSAHSNSTSASDHGLPNGWRNDREMWTGELSAVVGLQKRGLRGLMEGRRIRDREMGRGTSRSRDDVGGPGMTGNGEGAGLGLMSSPS